MMVPCSGHSSNGDSLSDTRETVASSLICGSDPVVAQREQVTQLVRAGLNWNASLLFTPRAAALLLPNQESDAD